MQLVAGGNIGLDAQIVEILIKTAVPAHVDLDIAAYLLQQGTQKVRGDQDMIFYGQTSAPNQSVVLSESASKSPYLTKLRINTAAIDPQIQKIAICATLSEPHTLSILPAVQLELCSAGCWRQPLWTRSINLKKRSSWVKCISIMINGNSVS